jgi:hypothetical protein
MGVDVSTMIEEIKERCQRSGNGEWSPPAFHAKCKLQKIEMDVHSGCLPAPISYKAVHVETSSSDTSSATTSFMVGQWVRASSRKSISILAHIGCEIVWCTCHLFATLCFSHV